MNKVLQQKYDRRVLEEDGCLFPKGMWGHPFNSRCTIVTMATIGNYQPNDLILDWGSGCGHQATTMTRLNCNFSRHLHLCMIFWPSDIFIVLVEDYFHFISGCMVWKWSASIWMKRLLIGLENIVLEYFIILMVSI